MPVGNAIATKQVGFAYSREFSVCVYLRVFFVAASDGMIINHFDSSSFGHGTSNLQIVFVYNTRVIRFNVGFSLSDCTCVDDEIECTLINALQYISATFSTAQFTLDSRNRRQSRLDTVRTLCSPASFKQIDRKLQQNTSPLSWVGLICMHVIRLRHYFAGFVLFLLMADSCLPFLKFRIAHRITAQRTTRLCQTDSLFSKMSLCMAINTIMAAYVCFVSAHDFPIRNPLLFL